MFYVGLVSFECFICLGDFLVWCVCICVWYKDGVFKFSVSVLLVDVVFVLLVCVVAAGEFVKVVYCARARRSRQRSLDGRPGKHQKTGAPFFLSSLLFPVWWLCACLFLGGSRWNLSHC